MKKVVWGAKLPNGKWIGGGNLDILNKISIKEKNCKHKWEPDYEECCFCGGGKLKVCSKCTQVRNANTNEIISE